MFEYNGPLSQAVLDYIDEYQFDGDLENHFTLDLSNINVGKCDEGLDGFLGTCIDFRGSSFRHSTLYGALFADSNLEGVDFGHCDLRGARFWGANLKNAKFEYANLGFANIGKGADLCGADLTEAKFCETVLVGTIYNSKTIFPEDFVVPDWMIFKRDEENNDEFHTRVFKAKAIYWESFSEEEKQNIIVHGFPSSEAVQQRFADVLKTFEG